MEGLVKNLNSFAQENETQTVYGLENDVFHPVCTLEALLIDLAAHPQGNIVPSPFYLGPIEVSENHDYVTAITDAEIRHNGTAYKLKAESRMHVAGSPMEVISGWVKSTTVSPVPVHDHWRRCLTEQKKPGGFSGLKAPKAAKTQQGCFLLPTLRHVGEHLSALVNSPEILMEYEEKKARYDALVADVSSINKDVWAKPTHMNKQEKAKKMLDKYYNGGKKATDLKAFAKTVDEFAEAIEKAKELQQKCEAARLELCTAVQSFSEFIRRPEFPESNGSVKKSVHSIKEALAPHQVDLETGMAAKLVTEVQSKKLVTKITDFIKRVENTINKPKWVARLMKPGDVLVQIKRIEPKLTSWNVRVTQGDEKDILEQLNQLIVGAKADASVEKAYDMGQIFHLADQLQAKFPIHDPAVKEKPKTTKEIPTDNEEMEEQIEERYSDYKNYLATFKANKSYMEQEHLEEFHDMRYNEKVQNAYEAFSKKPGSSTYSVMMKLFDMLEAFFHKAGIEDGEDSDEEEEEEEEVEYESSSSGEEEEPTTKRKRSRDEEEDSDLIGPLSRHFTLETQTTANAWPCCGNLEIANSSRRPLTRR